MVTNDKFKDDLSSTRARLFSPVYSLPSNDTKYCMSFKYSINGKSTDGFKVGIENYEDHRELEELAEIRGPLFDRWHLGAVEINRSYRLNRVRHYLLLFYIVFVI